MRRTALNTFLIVAILGLGCMGVAAPGKADEPKHPIELGKECKALFERYLYRKFIVPSFDYYNAFSYTYGTSGSYACGYALSPRSAVDRCNEMSSEGGFDSDQTSFPPGTTGNDLGGCKVYAKSPVNGKLAIVWKEEPKQVAKAEKVRLAQAARKAAEAKQQAAAPTRSKGQQAKLAQLRKANRYSVAVIIGNKNYQNKVPQVTFAHNDADAMRDYVVNKLGYDKGNIIDLRDVSQADLMATFGSEKNHRGKLFSYVRPGKSDIVVFYSGHGVPGLKSRKGYLLPVDADPDLVELNGYPIDVMLGNLRKIDARSTRVFVDACFSGDSPNGMLIRSASGIAIKIKTPEAGGGMTVVTAAQGDQFASWDEDAKHGLFTKHLLEALNGKADGEDYGNQDGKVTLAELRTYLDEEMTYQARRRYNRDQKASVQGKLDSVLATVR
jgi:hypothetical protein